MGKYSELSSTTEVNASAPCSVEYQLQAHFPDDKGQTYPAKDIPYTARTPQGVVEGTLNAKGEVILKDVGIGNVKIKVLDKADKEIKELRGQIKTILDGVIQEEREEAAKIAKAYNQKSYLGQVGENLKAEAKGVGNIGVGIWDGIKAIGGAIKEVGEQASEYILDPLHAPETFKEDVQAVKAKYYELKDTSTKAFEVYQTLKDDPKSWEMLEQFSSEYVDAQHSTELFEHGMEMVAGVILTIITGGAAAAALGARFAAASARLAPLLERLTKTLKEKKWFKKDENVPANTRAEHRRVLLAKKRVKCFCVGDHAKGGRKEYEQQLKHQQDGLNNTTADDYIQRRQAYTGKDICSDGYADGKTTARNSHVTEDANANRLRQQKNKYTDELIEKGIDPEKAEALAHAKAKAEVTGTTVGVFKADGTPKLNKDDTQRIKNIGGQDPLHNQDMVVGGRDIIGDRLGLIEFNYESFGSSDVNRHIGTQWNGSRASDIDTQACQARANGNGNENLNVELKPCGRHNSKHCPKSKGVTHRKAVQ